MYFFSSLFILFIRTCLLFFVWTLSRLILVFFLLLLFCVLSDEWCFYTASVSLARTTIRVFRDENNLLVTNAHYGRPKSLYLYVYFIVYNILKRKYNITFKVGIFNVIYVCSSKNARRLGTRWKMRFFHCWYYLFECNFRTNL